MNKKAAVIILLVSVCVRVIFLTLSNRDRYVPDYWTRFPALKDMYGQSQYMMKSWKYWLPDETVYSYAAGAYVRGASPILVEPTQPPLGKYLIGLSVLMTGNENAIVPVFFSFLVAGIFFLSLMLTGSPVIAMAAALASTFERLFTDQIAVTPLLDIFFVPCILFAVVTAAYALDRKKPGLLILAYGFLAASMMIKAWMIGMVFTAAITLYIMYRYRAYTPFALAGFAVIGVVFVGTYARLLMSGSSPVDVFRVQKWIYWYYSGRHGGVLTVWPLIFFNRWHVWWGEVPVLKDPAWTLSWPAATGIGLVSVPGLVSGIQRKGNPAAHLTALCIVSYSVFMSMGQASARYLLPFLPFCYAAGAWAVWTVLKKSKKARNFL
jgi:hypothetical protein